MAFAYHIALGNCVLKVSVNAGQRPGVAVGRPSKGLMSRLPPMHAWANS